MAGRKAISKKVRFEVFKRDSFKCQYCGKGAPDVVLHVDHIKPVSKGGKNDILNLVTACSDCNGGKSNIELSDKSALEKQRQQLEELNERREQLEMMVKWREGLASLNDDALEVVTEAWEQAVPGWFLNESGENEARKLIHKFGVQRVLDAIDIARMQYVKVGAEGKATQESVDIAWRKLPGICAISDKPEAERKLYYIRGVLRNRCYVNENTIMADLKYALDVGVDVEDMLYQSKTCRNWTQFMDWLRDSIDEARNG